MPFAPNSVGTRRTFIITAATDNGYTNDASDKLVSRPLPVGYASHLLCPLSELQGSPAGTARLAQAGRSAPELLAKSHLHLASLGRYDRLGEETSASVTAADPYSRRRAR